MSNNESVSLTLSEADLASAVVEQSPLAIAFLDLSTLEVKTSNQKFKALTACATTDGLNILNWLHEDDQPLLKELVDPLSKCAGEENKIEVRFCSEPEGTWRWMRVSTGKLPQHYENASQHALIYLVDIHAQKSNEHQESERARRWNYALVSSGLGVWDHNYRRQDFYYSPTWLLLRGYSASGPVPFSSTQEWLQHVHPDDRDFVAMAIERQKAGDLKFMNFEYRERHADGHWVWIECRGAAVEYFPDNMPSRIIGTDQDITERKTADALLSHTRQRLEMALTTSKIGVFEHVRSTKIIHADERVSEIFGFDDKPEQIEVERVNKLIHREDLKRLLSLIDESLRDSKPHAAEFRLHRENDGALRHVRHMIQRHSNKDNKEAVVGISWDITEEVRQRQDLVTAKQLAEARNFELDRAKSDIEHAALHDYLTSLPNRRYLEDELTRRIGIASSTNTKVALLQIDIDDFKGINSTYGHAAGDKALRHAAKVLVETSKHNDFIGRVGGDEFAMIVPDEYSSSKLDQIAKRLQLELAKPIPHEGARLHISVSIGLATQNEKSDATSLLKESDLALKAAKSKGHGHLVVYSPEISGTLTRNRVPSDRLMQAIDGNEFVPFYQPQYDALTLALHGVETLARWKHADGSYGAPATFIPLAQSLNLMNIIDNQILAQALEDHRRWQDMGLAPPRLSLNLSPHRLSDPALITSLQDLQIDTGTLTFELLESIFLDQQDGVSAYNLKQLRRLGINIDIDDFGTGYTSIIGLLKVGPNGLKIARELIAPLTKSVQQRAIVKSIVDIGKTLKIKIIAEGVETEEQARMLTDLGCDILQGFWLSKPLPAQDMEQLLHRETAETTA